MILVLTTVPKEKAGELMEKVLKEKLAGCAIAMQAKSMYWWKGKLEKDEEELVIFKSLPELKEKLVSRIKELHPYEVPFIASLSAEVNPSYLEWLQKTVKTE